MRFRILPNLGQGKLDLLEALALESSALLEALLGIRKFLSLQSVSTTSNQDARLDRDTPQ